MVVHPRRLLANVLFVPALVATLVLTTGCPTAPVTPPPPAAPSVLEFTVDRGEVISGGAVTFSWKTENASVVKITGADAAVVHTAEGAEAAAGTHVLVVDSGGTFVLTAEGGGKSVGARVAITIRNAPSVTEFIATPSEVVAGGETVLRWKVNSGSQLALKTQSGMSILTETDASIIAEGSKRVVVAADTTFILEAKNAAGTQTESVQVNVLRPAKITEFGASPTTLNVGETATLSWVAQDAVGITLTGNGDTIAIPAGTNPNGDNITVTPSVVTEYVLTAIGRGGDAERGLTVTVRPLPVVSAFTLAPAQITLGVDTATIAWTTANATAVEIRDQLGNLLDLQGAGVNDQIDVSPTQAGVYTYQLRATGPGGFALSDTLTLTVIDQTPQIVSFTSNVQTVTRGGTVKLTWDTSNAVSLSLTDGTATYDLTADGKGADDSITLTMDTVGTFPFVLSAANGDGVSVSSTPVVVTVSPPAPAIAEFKSSKNGVTLPGETFDLTWVTADASSVTIQQDGVDIVTAGPASGSHTVTLTSDGSYAFVLVAMGPTAPNATSSTVTVTAASVAPAVTSFTASPLTVTRGDTVTLDWSGTDASSYRVTANDALVYQGALLTTAHVPAAKGQVVYKITAIGAGGERAFATTQTVDVNLPAPVIASFVGTPTPADRDAPVTFNWSVSDAESLELSDGTTSYDVTGLDSSEISHTVEGTYSYILTARNTATTGPQSVVSTPVTIEVVQPNPTITSLTATPETITLGAQATLSWTARDVDSIELSDGTASIDLSGKNPSGDSVVVTPTENGLWTYTLTAKRAGATAAVETVTVTVNAAVPTFTLFDVSHPVTTVGDSNGMVWATTNTDDVYVSPYLRDAALPFSHFAGTPFEEISTTGTVLNHNGVPFSGDETVATLTFPAGFRFSYFGRASEAVKVSANGALGFGETSSGFGNNIGLKTAESPLNLVAPFWDDLKAFAGVSRLLYEVKDQGTTEERLIIQYDRFGLYESGNTPSNEITMQVALYRAGDIEFRYKTLQGLKRNALTGGSATIGIQGPTTDLGYQYSYLTSNQISEGRSLRIAQRFGGPEQTTAKAFTPSASVDVTLLAVGFNGSVRSPAKNVRVVAAPVASSFSVDRAHVGAGNAAVLSWATTDATEWKILADGVAMTGVAQTASGTLTVNPAATTEYTLVAENDADTAAELRRSVTVAAPVISHLGVDELIKELGETATFSWSTAGAEQVTLTTESGTTVATFADATARADVEDGSTTHVTEAGTRTYTLTAVNGSGTQTSTVTVESTSEARAVTFTATPSTVTTGAPVTFDWTTANAERVEIYEVANCTDSTGRYVLDTTDPTKLNPGSTTDSAPAVTASSDVTYKLIVSKAGGVSDEVCSSIRVLALPAFTSVDYSPNPAYVGSDTTLSWTTIAEDVARVRIIRPDGTVVADNLPSSGTHTLAFYSAVEELVFQGFNAFGVKGTDQPLTVNLVVPPPVFSKTPGNQLQVKFSSTKIEPASVNIGWKAENVPNVQVVPPVLSADTAAFIDVSGTGTLIPTQSTSGALTDDDGFADITPSGAANFQFNFMGQKFPTVRVSTNGWVAFELSTNTSAGFNYTFPNTTTSVPKLMAAPFWDDLDKGATAGAGIYFNIVGSTPGERIAIFQWKGWRPYTSSTETTPTSLNFQVQLHENGDVRFAYADMICGSLCTTPNTRNTGSSATIGLYNGLQAGDARYQLVGYNTEGTVSSNRSFVFKASLPSEGELTVSPDATTSYDFIAANDTGTVSALGRVTQIGPYDLVISEFVADPELDDTGKEWFEVRNLSSTDLDIRGLTISSSTNPGIHTVASDREIILPGTSNTARAPYVVFGQGGGVPLDYAYGSDLTADGLVFDNATDVITISAGSHVFDAVGYNTASGSQLWPVAEGRSTQLHPFLAQSTAVTTTYPRTHELGDDSRTWCISDSGMQPTPGAQNKTCLYRWVKNNVGAAGFASIRATGTPVIPTTTTTGAATAPNLPLPFPWKYAGREMTKVHVARYGYVSFSSSAPTTSGGSSGTPVLPEGPLATHLDEIIAPFKRLMTRNTATGKTPMVVTHTIGTAPDRKFVVEWVDHYPSGGTTSDILELQLQLHESGGFSFHYGNLVGGRSRLEVGVFGYQGYNAQIGETLGQNSSTTTANLIPKVDAGDVFTFVPVP